MRKFLKFILVNAALIAARIVKKDDIKSGVLKNAWLRDEFVDSGMRFPFEKNEMQVPLDHYKTNTNDKSMILRVRRLKFGENPENIMIFIHGGPGGNPIVVAAFAEVFKSSMPKNTWVYYLDPRGVGESEK